jgi:leader peptidase (prepilin peptidase) / N-methyltransferase
MKLIILLYALVIGSFLNVCIYRIPLGMSIALPRSFCPNCRNQLKWYDLIPVVSYLFLRGRCRSCKTLIKIQYPLVELLTAILGLLLYLKFGLTGDFFKYAVFFGLLIIISMIDLQYRRIPNVLSLSGTIIGLVWACFYGRTELFHVLLGIVVGGSVLLPIAYFYPQGMGMGDVKLLAMIGSFAGFKTVLFTLFAGSALGTVVGFVLICCKVITRKTAIPFGPFLAIGAVVVILFIV